MDKYAIITIDYEVFGDGSGHFYNDLIKPSNKILSILENNKVPGTFFFEILEIKKIINEYQNKNRQQYRTDIMSKLLEQVERIFKHNSDVQLHIHPQWFNAFFVKGKWVIDKNNLILSHFNGGTVNEARNKFLTWSPNGTNSARAISMPGPSRSCRTACWKTTPR